jgi:hypothetical protein
MIAAIRNLLGKADGVPGKRLLYVNGGLACLVAISHGGALALTYSKPSPDNEGIRQLGLGVPTSCIGDAPYRGRSFDTNCSRAQSPRIACRGCRREQHDTAAVGSARSCERHTLWELQLVGGLAKLTVAYSLFLISRFTLPISLRIRPLVFYAPVIGLVIAAPIDVGVFIRVMTGVGAHIGH